MRSKDKYNHIKHKHIYYFRRHLGSNDRYVAQCKKCDHVYYGDISSDTDYYFPKYLPRSQHQNYLKFLNRKNVKNEI